MVAIIKKNKKLLVFLTVVFHSTGNTRVSEPVTMSRQPNNNVKNRGVVPGVPGTSGPSLPAQDLPSPNCKS